MDIISIIIGLVGGGGVAWFLASRSSKANTQQAVEESNRKADLIIQEARLGAERISNEASLKAEKLAAKAEAENERIKQQKIQEAKQRYSEMRNQFDTEKAQHQLSLKEMEMDIVSRKKDPGIAI